MKVLIPINVIILFIKPIVITPPSTPAILPLPPRRVTPLKTIAVIALKSYPVPLVYAADLEREPINRPAIEAVTPLIIKAEQIILLILTPLYSATISEQPTSFNLAPYLE